MHHFLVPFLCLFRLLVSICKAEEWRNVLLKNYLCKMSTSHYSKNQAVWSNFCNKKKVVIRSAEGIRLKSLDIIAAPFNIVCDMLYCMVHTIKYPNYIWSLVMLYAVSLKMCVHQMTSESSTLLCHNQERCYTMSKASKDIQCMPDIQSYCHFVAEGINMFPFQLAWRDKGECSLPSTNECCIQCNNAIIVTP